MAIVLPNVTNSGTPVDLISHTLRQIPGLGEGILFLIFLSMVGFGYFAQDRKNGRGNIAMMCSIGGLITSVIAITLFLLNEAIAMSSVIVVCILSILFTTWFLMTGREDV